MISHTNKWTRLLPITITLNLNRRDNQKVGFFDCI